MSLPLLLIILGLIVAVLVHNAVGVVMIVVGLILLIVGHDRV